MAKINKLMLTLPNTRWFNLRYWHIPPYTLGLLTATLKDRYEVNILDANFDDLDFNEVEDRIARYEPDVIGISCMSLEYDESFKKLASIAKSACPETKVVVGGVYPTILPRRLIADRNIDYVVLGEGEYRFRKLLEYLENKNFPLEEMDGLAYRTGNGIVIQKVNNHIDNLDELPLPCYDNLDYFAYASKANKFSYYNYPRRFPYASTVTSRGCPFRCTFCSTRAICGPKIRYRSADSVLREIDWLVEKYGLKEMLFLDDNLYLDRKRMKKILLGLIDRKYDLEWKSINAAPYALNNEILELMRESGCYQISLALESGTEEGLRLMKKPYKDPSRVKPIVEKARALGFELGAMFVIGFPGETWEQIRRTIRFAEELDLDFSNFNIASPLPETELYRIAKEQHLLTEEFDFDSLDFHGFGRATIRTDEFTPEELEILRAFEWDRINFTNDAKSAKIAKMNGITIEELKNWRVSTRRGLGVKVQHNV